GALAAGAFLDGTSPWTGRVGRPIADAALTLIDDGTDPTGLPFPCDLAGRATRRVPMIVDGVLRTPAVDEALAARLGVAVTPHSFGVDEHRAGHLFLAAGGAGRADLMAAAEGGLTVAALEDAHLGTAPGTFRAVLRGVRRVARGEPAGAVEDLTWEGELAALFARVLAIGTDRVALAAGGPWGAAVTPPLALAASGTLAPRR
ncbi:MAG TPA: metallopeptidase TldD-related protein, partial [Thermoanaerobaculia bacterium]|nr:metallopeptidase TldD-related protein [Thermoanaerobaculia bacterium]